MMNFESVLSIRGTKWAQRRAEAIINLLATENGIIESKVAIAIGLNYNVSTPTMTRTRVRLGFQSERVGHAWRWVRA